MELYPVILRDKITKESIILANHDLPTPPLTYTNGIIIKKNYYPGNVTPTVQVLNRKTNEIEISGTFHDKKTGIDGYARQFIEQLMGMLNAARMIEFEYANFLFEALIEEVTPGIHTIHDIDYKLKINILRDLSDLQPVGISYYVVQPTIDIIYVEEVVTENNEIILKALPKVPTEVKNLAQRITETIDKIKEQLGLNKLAEIKSMINGTVKDINNIMIEVQNIQISRFIDKVNLDIIYHNYTSIRSRLLDGLSLTDTDQSTTQEYVVGQTETLYDIAKKFGTTANELADLNDLDKITSIQMGKKVVIGK